MQEIAVYITQNDTMVVFLEPFKQGSFFGTPGMWNEFPLYDEENRVNMMPTTRRLSVKVPFDPSCQRRK